MQTFRVAGLTIQVSAHHRLDANEKWNKFATAPSKPHLRYEVCYQDSLPPDDGEEVFADSHLRIVSQEQGRRYIYSNFCTSTVSASALESKIDGGFGRIITIPKDRYPWGTSAEHLFEVYDLPHYLPHFGKMLLHCAYVLFDGKAILFTAPSGTGKSTQAELWRKNFGAQIVNGDRAAIGLAGEIPTAYGLPFSGSSDDCENIDAPIVAIVSLSQAKENRLEKLQGRQALKALMRGAYLLPEHQADLPLQIEVAQTIMQKIPIYHLACLPEESAAQLLRSTLEKSSQCDV